MSRFEDYIKTIAPNIHIPSYAKRFENVVEVVRCKDCKYCSVDRYSDGNVPDYVCIEMDCGVEADGFCAWGERRKDAETD